MSKKVGKSLSSDFVQSEVIEGDMNTPTLKTEHLILMLEQMTAMTSAMDFAKNFGIRELLLKQARQLSNN